MKNLSITLLFSLSIISNVVATNDMIIAPGEAVAPGTVVKNISTTETKKGLTDADYMKSKNDIHDGYTQRAYDEACKGIEKECRGREPKHKFLGLDSSMVKAVAKAYSMIIGVGGGKLKTNKPKTDGTKGNQEFNDYCRYIAMGTETIGTVMQTTEQKNISSLPTGQGTMQKDQLYKAALSHKARAKTAQIQTIGFGSTTACYGIQMARGATIKSTGLKLAASGLLTAFFNKEKKINEDAYDTIKGIADDLPGKGDCNPITETACFCAQPETENDPKYCMDKILAKRQQANEYTITCLNNKLESDPNCDCQASKTCYEQKFNEMGPDFSGFGSAFNSGVYKPIANLANGKLVASNATGGSNKQAALANNILKKFGDKLPTPRLNQDQLKEVKAMESLGVPSNIAKNIAAKPLSGNAKKYMSMFKRANYGRKYAKSSKLGNPDLRFRGGQGLNKKKSSKNKSGYDFFKKFKKKRGSGGKLRDLTFANRAARKAQISRNTNIPIWEIISRRYKTSGKRRLED